MENDPICHSFVAPANWVEDGVLLQVDQGSAKKAALEQQCWPLFQKNDKGWTQHSRDICEKWLKMVDLLFILARKFGFVELRLT